MILEECIMIKSLLKLLYLTKKLDIHTKNVLSIATSLFAQDFRDNFVILGTFSNKDTILKWSDFVKLIENDNDLLNIVKKLPEKWWESI